MEIRFQDPTYSKSMKLGESFLDACKSATNGAGVYAFAEKNGIDLILGDVLFKAFINNYNFMLIVGTDSITDGRALSALRKYYQLYNNLTVYAFVHNSNNYLFHPKMAWFESLQGGTTLVGSGNLTERGMFLNSEFYSYSTHNPQEMKSIVLEWDSWVDHAISGNFLFDINDPIVDYAVALSSSKTKASFGKQPKTTGNSQPSNSSVPPVLKALYNTQPKPTTIPSSKKTAGTKQKPKSSSQVLSQNIPPISTPSSSTPSNSNGWKVALTDRVLIAEVPNNNKRWKQVNFDKNSFQTFFGATANGPAGTYRVLLKSVDALGNLGNTESRPSVSVASHNYRFEIDAASGLPYPQGNQRPYVVFVEISQRAFVYELLMPGDQRYTSIHNYVLNYRQQNIVKGMARIQMDAKALSGISNSLGLWKI